MSWAQKAHLAPRHGNRASAPSSAASQFPALGAPATKTVSASTAKSWSDKAKLASSTPSAIAPASQASAGSNASPASPLPLTRPNRQRSWADTASLNSTLTPVVRRNSPARSDSISTSSTTPTSAGSSDLRAASAANHGNASWARLASLSNTMSRESGESASLQSDERGEAGRTRAFTRSSRGKDGVTRLDNTPDTGPARDFGWNRKTSNARPTRQIWRRRDPAIEARRNEPSMSQDVAADDTIGGEVDTEITSEEAVVNTSAAESLGPERRHQSWNRIAAIHEPKAEPPGDTNSGQSDALVANANTAQDGEINPNSHTCKDARDAATSQRPRPAKLQLPTVDETAKPDDASPAADTQAPEAERCNVQDSSSGPSTATLVDGQGIDVDISERQFTDEDGSSVLDPPCIVDGSCSVQGAIRLPRPKRTVRQEVSSPSQADDNEKNLDCARETAKWGLSSPESIEAGASSDFDEMDDPGYTPEMSAGLRHLAAIAPEHYAQRADSHRLLCSSLDKMAECLSNEAVNHHAGRHRLLALRTQGAYQDYASSRDCRSRFVGTKFYNDRVTAVFSAIDTRKIHHFMCEMSRRGLLTLNDNRLDQLSSKCDVSAALHQAMLGDYGKGSAISAVNGYLSLLHIKRNHYKKSDRHAWCTEVLKKGAKVASDEASSGSSRKQALVRAMKATWLHLEEMTSTIPSWVRKRLAERSRDARDDLPTASQQHGIAEGGPGKEENVIWPVKAVIRLENSDPTDVDLLRETVDHFLVLASVTDTGSGICRSRMKHYKEESRASMPAAALASRALRALDRRLQVNRHAGNLSNTSFMRDGILDTDLLEAKQVNISDVQPTIPYLARLSASLERLRMEDHTESA